MKGAISNLFSELGYFSFSIAKDTGKAFVFKQFYDEELNSCQMISLILDDSFACSSRINWLLHRSKEQAQRSSLLGSKSIEQRKMLLNVNDKYVIKRNHEVR